MHAQRSRPFHFSQLHSCLDPLQNYIISSVFLPYQMAPRLLFTLPSKTLAVLLQVLLLVYCHTTFAFDWMDKVLDNGKTAHYSKGCLVDSDLVMTAGTKYTTDILACISQCNRTPDCNHFHFKSNSLLCTLFIRDPVSNIYYQTERDEDYCGGIAKKRQSASVYS